MILKTDCKHFPGDKPCKPNKLENKKCDDCEYYSPIKFKILIINFKFILNRPDILFYFYIEISI